MLGCLQSIDLTTVSCSQLMMKLLEIAADGRLASLAEPEARWSRPTSRRIGLLRERALAISQSASQRPAARAPLE